MAKILAKMIIALIRVYQLVISPVLPNACRYSPTCSAFGIEAIVKYGPFKGTSLALKRFLRCNPWGGHGHDPVP